MIEYDSNNSGGSWWLSDEDWVSLENAGWNVAWYSEPSNLPMFSASADGRWLGALASQASREGLTLEEAVAEWEAITGQSANAEGCDCCGRPHSFYECD